MACLGGHILREHKDQPALDIAFSLAHMLVKEINFLLSLPLKWSALD